MTAALLLVMMEPPASLEEEFNDWYDTEHVPQRLTLPGIENASRWVCIDGWPRWMALYDLHSMAAVETPEYLAVSAAHSTPWSRRILPRTIGRTRIVAQAGSNNDGPQIDPARVSRLQLARYPIAGDSAAAAIEATSRRLVDAGALQVRTFFETAPKGAAVWLTAAFAHPVGIESLRDCAGRCGTIGATLFNCYVPYHRA